MKTCNICNNKHHAKGYCKTHYNQYVLSIKPKQICSIEQCNNEVQAKGLCIKHYNRHKRHGNPLYTTRFRGFFSLTKFINTLSREELPDYVFKNRLQWSLACKLYYGDKCNECGWNDVTCDVHHIIEHSDKGINSIQNGIILCPNCHAKKHRHLPLHQRKYITRS